MKKKPINLMLDSFSSKLLLFDWHFVVRYPNLP